MLELWSSWELWDFTSGDVNWYNVGKWSVCFIKDKLTHIIWFNSSIPRYFFNENIFLYQDLYSNIHCTLIKKKKKQKLETILILQQVNGEKKLWYTHKMEHYRAKGMNYKKWHVHISNTLNWRKKVTY